MKTRSLNTLLLVFAQSAIGATLNVETLYLDVYTKWPSPTPELMDRFTDYLDRMPKNGIVAEVGVQQGGFSRFILNRTNPQKLYLIDCWEQQNPEVYDDPEANVPNNEQLVYYNRVQHMFGHDPRVVILKSYSQDAAAQFPDEYFDWVYIDANHGYDSAKEDIALWWPKVKKGGFLAGHDYIVRESFGVYRAVNEFLRDNKLYFTLLTNEEGKHDSWAIQKPTE